MMKLCVFVAEKTRLVESSDIWETVSHNDEAEMNFKCSARSDDSTPINTTWYKLETDHHTGEIYEMTVYNRSDKLTITGPDTMLSIKLAGNDSEGWAVYAGRYLCRATNGYSSAERLIVINVIDIPASGQLPHRYVMLVVLLIYCVSSSIMLFFISLIQCDSGCANRTIYRSSTLSSFLLST